MNKFTFYWLKYLTLLPFHLMPLDAMAKTNCERKIIDIVSASQVMTFESFDRQSFEPLKRQFFVFENGDLAIVNQYSCSIINIEIEYYYNHKDYPVVASNYLSLFNQFASHLELNVNPDMSEILIAGLKKEKISARDIVIEKRTDVVEYNFVLQDNDDFIGVYSKKIGSYMSIGGH